MRLRWITLTTEGVDSVILGLLTDGQLERALEIFETRRANQDAISKTMYLETIKALGRASEVDEALRIGKDAIEDHPGRNFSIVWFELLNVTSSCLHVSSYLGATIYFPLFKERLLIQHASYLTAGGYAVDMEYSREAETLQPG